MQWEHEKPDKQQRGRRIERTFGALDTGEEKGKGLGKQSWEPYRRSQGIIRETESFWYGC